MDRGVGEFGFEEVFVALPYTRSPGGVMARFGFTSAEDADIGGVRFRRYRCLATPGFSKQTADRTGFDEERERDPSMVSGTL